MKAIKMTSIILSTLLFLSIGCRGQSDNSSGTKQFRFNKSIVVDGLTRTYLVNLPPNYYDSSSFSLVIALHGGGGSGEQFEKSTGLTDVANSKHFIVVYPDGYLGPGGKRTWNAGSCCGAAQIKNINDVKFISELIDKLISNYKINPKRVYITGHSNGGMLTYRLASELANKIAAIAVNACSMVVTSPIHPSRPVPILHMHSKLDTHVPFYGGIGTGVTGVYFPPVDSVLNVWANIDACNTTPEITHHSEYTYEQWKGCSGNTTIELYLTDDGGHSWPEGNNINPNADPPSQAINADSLLWNFFEQHQLP